MISKIILQLFTDASILGKISRPRANSVPCVSQPAVFIMDCRYDAAAYPSTPRRIRAHLDDIGILRKSRGTRREDSSDILEGFESCREGVANIMAAVIRGSKAQGNRERALRSVIYLEHVEPASR